MVIYIQPYKHISKVVLIGFTDEIVCRMGGDVTRFTGESKLLETKAYDNNFKNIFQEGSQPIRI